MRTSALLATATLAVSVPLSGWAQERAPHVAEPLLTALEGTWRMQGHVRGRPVEYATRVSRTLAGRFVEVHMVDVASPPAYEARVFIGADTVAGRILVHWLDSFGAAFSVPHGIGHVSGDTLRFDVAYATGPFRDTLIFDRRTDTWHFAIEAGDDRGGWQSFATYTLRRAPPRQR